MRGNQPHPVLRRWCELPGCGKPIERHEGEPPNRYLIRRFCCIQHARHHRAAAIKKKWEEAKANSHVRNVLAGQNRCGWCGASVSIGKLFCGGMHSSFYQSKYHTTDLPLEARLDPREPLPGKPVGARTVEQWLAMGGKITRFEPEPWPEAGTPVFPTYGGGRRRFAQ